jgi:hypothetical protein
MRRGLLLAALLHLALAACTAVSSEGPLAATVEEAGIRYELQTASSWYEPGEVVQLTYRITNTTQDLFRPGGVVNCDNCTRQFHATRDDTEVWRTCRVIPPCGGIDFTLAPGETREWVEEWALTNDNGTMEPEDDFPLGPGMYTVVAELYLAPNVRRVPVSIELTIR